MADLVMGAMSSIIPKLYQLLEEEYKLQSSVKERISSLMLELELAQAALCKVAEVPWDQLDKQVQIWARKVREASYDMEDVLDTFLVRVVKDESADMEEEEKKKQSLRKHLKKMTNFFNKSKARRKISGDVKNIITHLNEMTEQCRRYKVEDIGTTRPASTIDPRLAAMYTQVNMLVGMDKSSGDLISMLRRHNTDTHQGEVSSIKKMKIVSIVGVGGLGKTTLAKVVYDKIKGDFDCTAFVPVGRNPDLKKILKDILIDLDKETSLHFSNATLDERQLIDRFHKFFLDNKKRYRYLIVIDDIWEKQSWDILKLATAYNKSCEGRIIITTRKWEVAKNVDEVYELPPLPHDSSRKLFYTRIYGDDVKYIDYQQSDEVSDEILRKCAGIPLAIITIASLLVDEPRDRWFELYKSIGFGFNDNEENAENIVKKILSFSYYDLPSHLRTCLLYLSAFPEDSFIPKVPLVWMWVAEGFVHEQKGKGLFKTGEGYFNDLINRSLIQDAEPDHNVDGIHGCSVHDMVLDFIRSMSREENFLTVFDNNNNDQGTVIRSNVLRRLAHHNKVHSNQQANNMFDMSKVRSFIALGLDEVIDSSCVPNSSFKLLRVLKIGYYNSNIIRRALVEPLGHLLHLRYLSISGRRIKKIPKEIEALKMLQTLDLSGSIILEADPSSSSSLPTQLMCLRIVFDDSVRDAELLSVGRLTSLEELSIHLGVMSKAPRLLVKELGSLRKLRVLSAWICLEDDETERDLIEAVCHLHNLQHLKIGTSRSRFLDWQHEKEFVLRGDLRYLAIHVVLSKLPSCIDPLCHRRITHLDLCLLYMDEQELKILGRLPELRLLELDLRRASPAIRNISDSDSDSDACYFPKLRCLGLKSSLLVLLIVASNNNKKKKKSVSFHIWDGKVDNGSITAMPYSSSVSDDDAEFQGRDDGGFSSVFQSETETTGRSGRPVGEKSDDEEEKKQGGSISIKESEGERAAATPAAGFIIMPSLQELHFRVREQAVRDPRYCHRLGLEFLSSLREIRVRILVPLSTSSVQVKEVKEALMRAAQLHPNHPTLHID